MFKRIFFGILSFAFLAFSFTALSQTAKYSQPGYGLGIAGGGMIIDPDFDKTNLLDVKLHAYMSWTYR